MGYVIQAVLSNAQHPEYGQITIPFPIPKEEYDHTIELLEPLGIGDTLRQDCKVDDLDSFYTVLNALIGKSVTLDELDYLAKRLDSFDDGEAAQFQGMAHKLGITQIKDIINLTFCCQQATVITDFSDLKEIGQEHYMNLNGGSASVEELENLDGVETALLLIDSGVGTVTPYGVVYAFFPRGMDMAAYGRELAIRNGVIPPSGLVTDAFDGASYVEASMRRYGLSAADHGYAAWNGGELQYEYSQPEHRGPLLSM